MARRNPLSSWYAKSRIRRFHGGIVSHGVKLREHGIWRLQTRCPDIGNKTHRIRRAILKQCRKNPGLRNTRVPICVDDQRLMVIVALTLSGVIHYISVWPEMTTE